MLGKATVQGQAKFPIAYNPICVKIMVSKGTGREKMNEEKHIYQVIKHYADDTSEVVFETTDEEEAYA